MSIIVSLRFMIWWGDSSLHTKVYCFVVVDRYAYFLILFENLGAFVASGVQGAGQHFLLIRGDSSAYVVRHLRRL